MNKTKSKVLSLVLASAMIVSSFSSLNFASAATTRETGKLTVTDDELYLASNTDDDTTSIDDLLGNVTLKTYDNEEASDVEFVSYTHASGDSIVKSIKDKDDEDDIVTLKKDAQGKEVITVTYEGEYDRDDKTVKVRGKKDITIYADPIDAQILAENGKDSYSDDKPDDVDSAAVNDKSLDFAIYKVSATGLYSTYSKDTSTTLTGKVKKDSDKAFAVKKDDVLNPTDGVYSVPTKYIEEGTSADTIEAGKIEDAQSAVSTAKTELAKITATATLADAKEAANAAVAAFASVSTGLKDTTAKSKLADAISAVKAAQTKVNAITADPIGTVPAEVGTATTALDNTVTPLATALTNANKPDAIVTKEEKFASTGTINVEFELATKTDKTEKTTLKLSVEKKWRAEQPVVEVNKKGSTTYVTRTGGKLSSWDSDDLKTAKDNDEVYAISGYDIAAYNKTDVANTIYVTAGKVGNIKGNAKTTVDVDDGSIGDIKANIITMDDGSAGTLKQKGDDPTITITEGKVKAIDADKAKVIVNGGTISGDITAATVDIDASDEDVPTTISGNVEAKASEATVEISASSDAAVKVTGTVKGAVTLSDENVSIGTLDADYENEITFDDFTGKLGKIINSANVDVNVNGDSKVTVSGKLQAGSLEIEDEEGKVTADEGYFNSVSGDGTLAVPAGKLFIEDSMEDVTLQLTSGLVAGATAFTAYTDAVDVDDFTALGYTLEQKAANSDVDKFVIKSVTFAGVQLDKSELSIAKGQTATLTATAYPTGTDLPAGSTIDWSIDGNDDYISMTTEGNTATIKVLDYNTNYATDNQATITATVVDENGNTVDKYVAATTKVTATALPASVVTLDTTKPVTVGTGAVYQYIAKSSTAAVLSAASSDTQIATVELFNAADPRGYKFQVKGVAVGTATITTTDANGATATLTVNVVKVDGTLRADTTTYTFAPGKVYDVKFSTTGTTAVPVVTVNGKVVSIAPRGNGVYRVTAQNPGTAFVVATVGNTHVSVKFVVANGAASVGVKGNNVSTLK